MRARGASPFGGLHPPPDNRCRLSFALWALSAAVVCCVPVIYQIRWLFIIWLPLLAAFPFVAIVWLVRLVGAAFRGNWKRALSLAMAGATFGGFASFALGYSRDIRFQTMRPFYLMQIGRLSSPAGEPKRAAWQWAGGVGYDERLEYDEADRDAPPPGQSKLVRRREGNCTETITPMGGHFYLRIADCE